MAERRTQPGARYRPLARGDACGACRTRKVRCPGQRPACANCTKHGRECVYSDTRYVLSTPMADEELISPPSNPIPTPVSLPEALPALPALIPVNPFYSQEGIADPNLFPFTTFLPMQDMATPNSWGQTLPPEYASIDIDQLLRDVAQTEGSSSAPAPAAPTEAELEHLLWMYFSHQRLFCVEMHIGTFWSRQRAADPSERPHPCLLNAIYLVTCWASPSASIKSRSVEFYKAAKTALEQSIQDQDRPIDAVRAGTLLACWLYGTARFGEGAVMVSTTSAVAISCGLNNIASARWTQPAGSLYSLQRHAYCHSYRAESQLDLADRIYAFWAIFLCERCATVSQNHPENFKIDRVSTPLPRRWAEYENPGDHLDSHETLFDLMMGRPAQPDCTDFANTLKAMELVTRASHLRCEVGGPDFNRGTYPPAVWSGGERTRSEKAHIQQALKVFTDSLPPTLRPVVLPDAGSVSNTCASMQYLVGAAEIFLHDSDTLLDENTEALVVVRRLLGVMHHLGERNDWGDVGLFVVMIWNFMGRLLIREALRLESIGDTFSTALVDAEIRFVKDALRSRGRQIKLAELQLVELMYFWPENRSEADGIPRTLMELKAVK